MRRTGLWVILSALAFQFSSATAYLVEDKFPAFSEFLTSEFPVDLSESGNSFCRRGFFVRDKAFAEAGTGVPDKLDICESLIEDRFMCRSDEKKQFSGFGPAMGTACGCGLIMQLGSGREDAGLKNSVVWKWIWKDVNSSDVRLRGSVDGDLKKTHRSVSHRRQLPEKQTGIQLQGFAKR